MKVSDVERLHFVWGKHYARWSDAKVALASNMDSVSGINLSLERLLQVCESISADLLQRRGVFAELRQVLLRSGNVEAEAELIIEELAQFIGFKSISNKLERELGSRSPTNIARVDFAKPRFETWAPLGVLVHIAPSNAPLVSILSVIEGLLLGNCNILKLGTDDSNLALLFFAEVIARDSIFANYIAVCRVSSGDHEAMRDLLSHADAVACWGGEAAIAGVKSFAPQGVRFIEWGPKISFAYVSASRRNDNEVIKGIVKDIVLYDQQACSSPQCVYVETNTHEELSEFGHRLAAELAAVSPTKVARVPDWNEAAELSLVTELVRSEQALGICELISAADRSWRVIIDKRSQLAASPLFRTIWIRPLQPAQIVSILKPMRDYLQTVAIACMPHELIDLSQRFACAGALRFTESGAMHESYDGEPHDGRYALAAYGKRISWQLNQSYSEISRLDELSNIPQIEPRGSIMSKADFQAMTVAAADSQLFFRSGGSSGAPKISIFNYSDYHAQMRAAADGLVAAGVNPAEDRCMNLFFAGGLYGGFLSFFTILESLKAVQLPMAVVEDLDFVVDRIIDHQVNTLLGMPSYLFQLLQRHKVQLRGKIEKIFFGGEAFTAQQYEWLYCEIGVKIIRSASYGSVDAGPLGFQCSHCEPGVHHLLQSLQTLEILTLDNDQAVSGTEVGRLVFTSKQRHGQTINRYDIGDLGSWVNSPDQCPCGRTAPRFLLRGRHGDSVRVGTTFVSHAKLLSILGSRFGYAGSLQLHIYSGVPESVTLLVEDSFGEAESLILDATVSAYPDVAEVVQQGLLQLSIKKSAISGFTKSKASSKVLHSVDHRS